VIEEGRKKPRNSRYEKKSLKITKKLKKRLQIFLYLVYSAIPTNAAMVLEGQKNFAHLHEKRTFFFCFKCFIILPQNKTKKLQMTPQYADDFMF